jgi:hypothetical protein
MLEPMAHAPLADGIVIDHAVALTDGSSSASEIMKRRQFQNLGSFRCVRGPFFLPVLK